MSTLKVNNIQDTSGGATTLVSAQNTAKAWVRFDGSASTPSIFSAYNVSTIGDRGTGEYTLNFSTALADTDYAVAGINAGNSFCSLVGTIATTSVDIRSRSISGNAPAAYDSPNLGIIVFGS